MPAVKVRLVLEHVYDASQVDEIRDATKGWDVGGWVCVGSSVIKCDPVDPTVAWVEIAMSAYIGQKERADKLQEELDALNLKLNPSPNGTTERNEP